MERCTLYSAYCQMEQFFNIGEKVVEHRPRKYGETKFGIERFLNGFLDLISVSFVNRYKREDALLGLWGQFHFWQVSLLHPG